MSNATGFSQGSGIVATDIVPNGYTYVAGSIAGGDSRDATNPATSGLTWTINSLGAGASVTLTFQATVLGSGIYTNYTQLTAYTSSDVDSAANNGTSPRRTKMMKRSSTYHPPGPSAT